MSLKCIALVATVIGMVLPSSALAAGAWTTYLKPYSYTDLLAAGDTVWCATLEAGLVQLTPSTGTFTSYVREPGRLSSNRINALALDRSKRLWVGTVDAGVGLLSADRQSWSVVNAFDGLPSDTVTVLEAVSDTMWIGTPRGLALWSGFEIAGTLPDRTSPSPFASDFITGIVPLGDTLWIATLAGVYRGLIPTGLDPVVPINTGLADLEITDLASDGHSVFALSDVVYRFDRPSARWVVAGGAGDVLRLSDDHGVVLASSRLGAYRWDGAAWVLEATLTSNDASGVCPPDDDLCGVFALTTDASGTFYGANHRGVYLRPGGVPPLVAFEPPSPPGNNLLNLLVQGPRVYASTSNEGFGRFDGAQWRIWPPLTNNSDTTFARPIFGFGMAIDRLGRKWIGCWDWALERFDDSVSPPVFEHLVRIDQPLDPNDPLSGRTFAWGAAVDSGGPPESGGGVWFGNHSPREEAVPETGLDYYDDQDRFFNYQPGATDLRGGRIHALTVDRTGTIWLGYAGRGGIGRFARPDSAGGPITVLHVPDTENDDVRGIAALDTSVWVLTTSELRRYNFVGGLRDVDEVPASPAELALHPLDIGPDGTAWVGTVSGLSAYRRNGDVESFTTANSPLPNNEVRAVRVDPASGVVWIGTAAGMARFDPNFVTVTPEVPRLDVRVFPNPARINRVSLGLRLTGNSVDYVGRIHDLTGRLMHRFRARANDQVIWDGRDLRGDRVRPGIYFVRVQAGGRIGFARVVVLR